MAVEIKETSESAVENVVMGADLVTGAAVTVAENVTRAVSHPVREARKIERRRQAVGKHVSAANKKFGKDVADIMEDTAEIVGAVMPEKVALLGIHAIKDRARRKDLIGDVAYRTLARQRRPRGGAWHPEPAGAGDHASHPVRHHPHPPGAARAEGRPKRQADRPRRRDSDRQERPFDRASRDHRRSPHREEELVTRHASNRYRKGRASLRGGPFF